jgi:hypothetical protein
MPSPAGLFISINHSRPSGFVGYISSIPNLSNFPVLLKVVVGMFRDIDGR